MAAKRLLGTLHRAGREAVRVAMASLRDSLPQPSRFVETRVAKPHASEVPVARQRLTLQYGSRAGGRFAPKSPDDFADGGAYPEVHQVQYPRGFGAKGASKPGGLQVTMDASGNANFDAIVTRGKDPNREIHTGHDALVPRPNAEFARPSEDQIQATLDKTKATILGRVDKKTGKTGATAGSVVAAPEYIKYTPANQNAAGGAGGASHRLIKMHQTQSDPLEPPKFRHKKVPRGPGSPPVPVLHSPPRNVTTEEQGDWKIPPSISNWKNPKGYTIPLDKRLAADGRGLQEVQINDNFARLSEALYLAEQKAREAVETRAKIQHEILNNEKSAKEDELRDLAQRARVERAGGAEPREFDEPPRLDTRDGGGYADDQPRARQTRDDEDEDDDVEKRKRDEIRDERRREREKERRLEGEDGRVGKKTKLTRDRDRDVSEQIALGQSNVANKTGEHAYDQRLFDQTQGIGSGFHGDDAYDVYDKPLFNDKSGGIYKPTAETGDDEGARGGKGGPVEFQRHDGGGGANGANAGGDDPFGLDAFLDEVKGG